MQVESPEIRGQHGKDATNLLLYDYCLDILKLLYPLRPLPATPEVPPQSAVFSLCPSFLLAPAFPLPFALAAAPTCCQSVLIGDPALRATCEGAGSVMLRIILACRWRGVAFPAWKACSWQRAAAILWRRQLRSSSSSESEETPPRRSCCCCCTAAAALDIAAPLWEVEGIMAAAGRAEETPPREQACRMRETKW
jgi:hypothetical protein